MQRICNKRFIWNPSNCDCECDDTGKCLGYENCKCRKKLVDKLIERSYAEECTESID